MGRKYWWKSVISFLIVLTLMPLMSILSGVTHNYLEDSIIYYVTMGVGLLGLLLLIFGSTIRSDSGKAIYGLFGAFFVWTGWVESIFDYYCTRFGLGFTEILPVTAGLCAVMAVFYVCVQKTKLNAAVAAFSKFCFYLWTVKIITYFLFDEAFFGPDSYITLGFGALCLIIFFFLFAGQLSYKEWGSNMKEAITSAFAFWTAVDIARAAGYLPDVWTDPFTNTIPAMVIVGVFAISSLAAVLTPRAR